MMQALHPGLRNVWTKEHGSDCGARRGGDGQVKPGDSELHERLLEEVRSEEWR